MRLSALGQYPIRHNLLPSIRLPHTSLSLKTRVSPSRAATAFKCFFCGDTIHFLSFSRLVFKPTDSFVKCA